MLIILFLALTFADSLPTYKIYKDTKRYKKALEKITSDDVSYSQIVSIAFKALKNK